MSFGTGPYGSSGLGMPTVTTAATQTTTIVSSQAIDGVTKDYLLADDGNPIGMDDTMQRVMLLTAFEVDTPKLVGLDFEATMSAQIRKALLPMTASRPPAIRIDGIDIDSKNGTTQIVVNYTNLLRGTRVSVKVR